MNVLVVAPHPDDEAIGCGGALALHADSGDHVQVVFLTSGELGLRHLPSEEAWRVREGEAEKAAAVLGISDVSFLRRPDWLLTDDLEAVISDLGRVVAHHQPDRVFVPHEHESHPDHQAAFAAMVSAAARCGLASTALLRYEVWTPLAEFDMVEDISEVMPRKLQAITCYASQLSGYDYLQAATGLSLYRGALAARRPYAEVFDRCSGHVVAESN